MFFNKPKKVASTPFSDFIRNASSGEKKKVYKTVLTKATELQKDLMRRHDTTEPSLLDARCVRRR